MPIPRTYVVNIGDVNPIHSQITVVEEIKEVFVYSGKRKYRRKLILKCSICSKDEELWGDGIFKQSSHDYVKGMLPCGCSKSAKLSIDQWEVLIKRRALKNNLDYRGYIGDWIGQNTKLKMFCTLHNYEYSTCSVRNLLRHRTCPKCALDKRIASRKLPDNVFIDRWKSLGAYPEGTIFKRLSGRLWELTCPFCIDEVFISDKSNLDAGKRPCNCTRGGGYNKALSGYVYILKVDGLHNRFTGFGISNFFNKRLAEHTRSLNKEGLSVIDSCNYFFEDGTIPLDIEKAIKYKFPLARQEIAGFKTEATHYDLFLDVRNFVEDYIENVAK